MQTKLIKRICITTDYVRFQYIYNHCNNIYGVLFKRNGAINFFHRQAHITSIL